MTISTKLRSPDEVRELLLSSNTLAGLAELMQLPLSKWRHNCHEVSLKLVRTGLLGPDARVARGFCDGVMSQHSWVAPDGDCYRHGDVVVDLTRWSYDETKPVVYVTKLDRDGEYRPHGAGNIFEWGQPTRGTGPTVKLTPTEPLSELAKVFLSLLGPLDRAGWATLTNAPVEDWPAGEIYAAMDDTDELKALVPIDKLGMLTDRNPCHLYR